MSNEKSPAVEPVETATPAAKAPISWPRLAVAALFGLIYAYFVYQAIGNLIELPKSYDAIGLSNSVPWVLLIIGLLVPLIVYVLAFAIGLRRRMLDQTVIFIMGIAVTAALGYTVVAIHRLAFIALISGS